MRRGFSLSGIGLGVFLMGLGIAYMIDVSSGTYFWKNIFRFYPVLPILLGIDFILTTVPSDQATGSQGRPGGWIITVIILITFGGLMWNIIPRVLSNELKDIEQYSSFSDFELQFNKKNKITRNDQFILPPGITTVRIESTFGDLRVKTGKSNVVIAATELKSRSIHHQNLKSYLNRIQMRGEAQGRVYSIKLTHPDGGTHLLPRFTTSIDVEIPQGLNVELVDSFGELKVAEVDGNLNVENRNGRIEIGKVTGDATVNNRLGEVSIGEVTGNLTVNVSAGQIGIQRVGKNLVARNDLGNLNVGDIAGDFTAVGKSGNIEVIKIGGQVKVESTFGAVRLKDCQGPVNAEVSTGDLNITISRLKGPLDLNNKFGSIHLTLPRDTGFIFNSEASFGSINSEFNVSRYKKNTGESAGGEINGGGPLVKINVQNGSIQLKKRL